AFGADVDLARGHVGALDVVAQANEVVGRVVAHAAGHQAGERLATLHDLGQELVTSALGDALVDVVAGEQVELVDHLPALGGNEVARGAHVLARAAQRGQDGPRIPRIGDEKLYAIAVVLAL